MTFRLGRLRWPELLMLPISVWLLWATTQPRWFVPGGREWYGVQPDRMRLSETNGFGAGLIGWIVILVALLAVGAVLTTLLCRSAAGPLAFEIALTVAAPFAGIALAITLIFGEPLISAHYLHEPVLTQVCGGVLTIWLLAIWGIRSESRGLRPDSTPEPISLSLDGQRPAA